MARVSLTNRELINYLERKIINLSLPHDIINDVFLYDTPPDKLTAKYEGIRVGKLEWYFFTERRRICEGSDMPERIVGGYREGYWATSTRREAIYDEEQVIGHKQTLKFYDYDYDEGDDSDDEVVTTNWFMDEFTIDQTQSSSSSSTNGNDDHMRLDWAVCRIYKKIEDIRKPYVFRVEDLDPPISFEIRVIYLNELPSSDNSIRNIPDTQIMEDID